MQVKSHVDNVWMVPNGPFCWNVIAFAKLGEALFPDEQIVFNLLMAGF